MPGAALPPSFLAPGRAKPGAVGDSPTFLDVDGTPLCPLNREWAAAAGGPGQLTPLLVFRCCGGGAPNPPTHRPAHTPASSLNREWEAATRGPGHLSPLRGGAAPAGHPAQRPARDAAGRQLGWVQHHDIIYLFITLRTFFTKAACREHRQRARRRPFSCSLQRCGHLPTTAGLPFLPGSRDSAYTRLLHYR